MLEWFAGALRTYPEIAIFLALDLSYYFGNFTFRGIGLGIGQIGVTIQQPLKATVCLPAALLEALHVRHEGVDISGRKLGVALGHRRLGV